MSKCFTWDAWDYDCEGTAYVIAKSEVPERENVAKYIIEEDGLDPTCGPEMCIREGWCKWQVRTDWMYGDGVPRGGYVVEEGSKRPTKNGKPLPGWFPVWLIRKDEWY